MRFYTQLTREQRYQISALLKMEHNHTEIAGLLHVHKSTVGRDINRNRGRRGYRPRQADQKACNRRKTPRRIVRIQWDEVDALLRQDWSPEQVSGWLKTQEHKSVSHEWIYQHILADKHSGGDLYRHLRCQKQRRKRYGCYDRRGTLPNRVSIDKRPEIVNSRQRLGDWEVDTVIGKGQQQAIVTLTERKSRLGLIRKVDQRTAQAVKEAILVLLQPWMAQTHTLTSDNGKEFALHQQIAEQLQATFFFSHPYSAWERGANENMNGLLRQYFPKAQSFKTVTDDQITSAMHRLNNRPRKTLAFRTPFEVFSELSSVALVT
jgi:IS30 family transposase